MISENECDVIKNSVHKEQWEMEDSCRRLIEKPIKEGKGEREIEAELMAVFALSQEKAMEKINCCQNKI